MAKTEYVPSEEEKVVIEKVGESYKIAKDHFLAYHRNRFDKFYKLYRSYTGDRFQLLKQLGGEKWMSNIFIPYIFSTIETLLPRVIDTKPEFIVRGRTEKDHKRADKIQQILDYLWEISKMDLKSINFVKAAKIYGTSIGKVRWRKEVNISRKLKRDKQHNIILNEKTKKPETDEVRDTFYDNPDFDPVDIFSFFPDPMGSDIDSCSYVVQRYLMTKKQIKNQYFGVEDKLVFLEGGEGDLSDVSLARQEVLRNVEAETSGQGAETMRDPAAAKKIGLIEIIEYWEDDFFAVVAGGVLLKSGNSPFRLKKKPYVRVPCYPLPDEFYGIGICEILEKPQEALNSIRNQRIDNATLGIHKMFIVNPLTLMEEEQLITRPFGIIYSSDPNAVRPLEFGDVKESAYLEDDALIDAMRTASGVDDYSRGRAKGEQTATGVSSLIQSTLERVKLFARILEQLGYSEIMRMWFAMIQQFYDKEKIIRIIGKDSKVSFPLIKPEDIQGQFDFLVASNSTLAATNEIRKKQDVDLLERVTTSNVGPRGQPVVDIREVWRRVLSDFGWNPDEILLEEEPIPPAEQPPAEQPPVEQSLPPIGSLLESQPGILPSPQDQIAPPSAAIGNLAPPNLQGNLLGGSLGV